MEGLGYSRYKGAWRLKQEIEIESRQIARELAEKKLRKDIRNWFEQLASGGRYAEMADRNLKALESPLAASALAEILVDRTQPRTSRLLSLSLLSKVAPGRETGTLIRLAMDEPDEAVGDACLEELKRLGPQASLPAFVAELKGKDNARINRAAECIERVGDKSATLPLINALVTEHRIAVPQGGAPGSMTTTFGSNSLGVGGGGLAMGGKPKIMKQQVKNPSVLAALATLHPDVSFQYDADAWLNWYIQTTTTTIDLRRDD
jgi:HEAT repeat protein